MTTAVARYTSTNIEKSTTFFATLSATMSDNYIGNNTLIASRDNETIGDVELQPGAQITQPVNLEGYRTIRSFLSYGVPFSLIKSNLNLTANFNYSRTPEMINNELNFAIAPTLGLGWVLSSNISEKVDFTLSSNSSFNLVDNSLQNLSRVCP